MFLGTPPRPRGWRRGPRGRGGEGPETAAAARRADRSAAGARTRGGSQAAAPTAAPLPTVPPPKMRKRSSNLIQVVPPGPPRGAQPACGGSLLGTSAGRGPEAPPEQVSARADGRRLPTVVGTGRARGAGGGPCQGGCAAPTPGACTWDVRARPGGARWPGVAARARCARPLVSAAPPSAHTCLQVAFAGARGGGPSVLCGCARVYAHRYVWGRAGWAAYGGAEWRTGRGTRCPPPTPRHCPGDEERQPQGLGTPQRTLVPPSWAGQGSHRQRSQ